MNLRGSCASVKDLKRESQILLTESKILRKDSIHFNAVDKTSILAES